MPLEAIDNDDLVGASDVMFEYPVGIPVEAGKEGLVCSELEFG